MFRFDQFLTRGVLRYAGVVLLDAGAVAVSFILAFQLRMQGQLPPSMEWGMGAGAPVAIIVSLAAFHMIGLYHRAWRYVSIGDLLFLVEATMLAVALSFGAIVLLYGTHWILPASVPIIQWFILLVMLGGLRVSRRLVREALRGSGLPAKSKGSGAIMANDRANALLVGDPDWADMLLRALRHSHGTAMAMVGVLAHDGRDRNLKMRGVPILGSIDNLEDAVESLDRAQRRPKYLIVNQNDPQLTGPRMVKLVNRAEQLGLEVARAPDPAGLHSRTDGRIDLQFLNLPDLLGRPELNLDPQIIADALAGRRVLVTGAGGTIGGELVRQIAASGPAEIILLDNGEFNLYSIELEMREKFPDVPQIPVLCSIYQRERLMDVFAAYKPEFVFHAAALKHVPLVEGNPCAGVQTNVIGTRNVADAVRLHGALAMVQVSTDKAVNPVGMMGATKRLGELYCQALDLAGADDPTAPRFLTVRFGNVLGSSGSLIPLFQRQLSRHGPLTVTHPEIRRYFMTVHEAVQLILQSTARALRGGADRGRIFVLDMGEPIRIVDIARRMIRLAGLEPDVDIRIEIVGLRPGEKLFEELFDESEEQLTSSLPGIFEAEPNPVPLDLMNEVFHRLDRMAQVGNTEGTCHLVHSLLDYRDGKESAALAMQQISKLTAGAGRIAATAAPVRLQGAAS